MMRSWFSHIDRSVALGAGILVASLALLGAAVVSIFAALNNDGANLPDQGSIEQILSEGAAQSQAGAAAKQLDWGPLPPPPVRLDIPGLYIDPPIVARGLDAERYPQVPERRDRLAWCNFTAVPAHSTR